MKNEVYRHGYRSHMLQADSEYECNAWVQAIQAGVTKAYAHHRDSAHETSTQQGYMQVRTERMFGFTHSQVRPNWGSNS